VRFDKEYAQTYFNASVGSVLPEAPPEGRKTTRLSRSRVSRRGSASGHQERFAPPRLSAGYGSEGRRSPECAATGETRRKRPVFGSTLWRGQGPVGRMTVPCYPV